MDITINTLLQYVPSNAKKACAHPNKQILCMKPLEKLYSSFEDSTIYAGPYNDSLDLKSYSRLNMLVYTEDRSLNPDFPGDCNIILVYGRADYDMLTNKILESMNNNTRLNLISNELLNIIQTAAASKKCLIMVIVY